MSLATQRCFQPVRDGAEHQAGTGVLSTEGGG